MIKRMWLFLKLNLREFIYSVVLLASIFAFNQNAVFAQPLHNSNSVVVYPGGNSALKEFISKNLHYPEEARKAGVSGIVQVAYLINYEGKVQNIRVMRGISPECDAEAIRVTSLITGWTPAYRMEKPVDMMVSMPVEFQSEKKLQPVVVTGKVTDKSKDMPIDGALVIIKGTSNGTVTKADGLYSLEVKGENQYLEFYATGYTTKVEPVSNHSTINVEMDTEYFIIDFNVPEN